MRPRPLPHQGIALAMVGAPLGMADDDGAGAGIGQHFGGNIAGMGAGGLGMAILRRRPRAFDAARLVGESRDQGRRRADQQIGLGGHRAAPASMASNSASEAFRPFIFQLPAISGRMASVMSEFPSK